MEAIFASAENTQISWTNEQGQVWSVPYPLADGQIPNQVQDWLDEGNSIGPYVAPPPPPATQVTAYQAKIQLSRAGLYDTVVTIVNTSDNPELKIAWEVATTFERNTQFILALQPELGLTDAQVDDLFQQASLIGTTDDLQSAKTTEYNQAVSERDTLVANLVDPTTDASIAYISMLDDRLIEIQQEINSASTQQQLDAIDFNFPVFGG